jgi:alkylhydroperoxidase/carboxymuconolactone decarboxylase family protein YurZ
MASKHLEQYIWMQALAEQLGSETEKFMSAFVEFQEQVLATGALSHHIKQLMAFTIVLALGRGDCLDTYLRDALKAGATRDEVLEAIGVAMLMGGAPVTAYGSQALDALNQM